MVNDFIDRLLRERLSLTTAIENFIRDRGRHEGEHVFDLTVCSLCDQAYIHTEAALDNVYVKFSPANQEITAIIERCLAGGSEDVKPD